jgi:hypothetical protein
MVYKITLTNGLMIKLVEGQGFCGVLDQLVDDTTPAQFIKAVF